MCFQETWSAGRGLAAGQDGRHSVRLCQAAGRSSYLFLLQAVLAGADSGGTPGKSRRHLGRGGGCDWGRRCGLTRAGRPEFRPRARPRVRGVCGELLPANTLCRERERLGRPDRQLDRAAAPQTLQPPWTSWPFGFCGAGAVGGACFRWHGGADGRESSRVGADGGPPLRGGGTGSVDCGGQRVDGRRGRSVRLQSVF
ncbi:hypothetical protein NDU88_002969 [Pleurodeles waltl]|uniref:Uncharacterized protein n=1 Tax=Pleurodeles waltl TaxID=8319 RepID=A0AAV7LQR0_PLEWA|nr:hypothetical protein NDU88_002969 [Pleurodeles waltl]